MTKDEHNAAPFTPAEIAEKLARKGQFYSSADGSKQYNQYPIAEKSKRIMGLDFGGGRIVAANRMMLGIKQAPAHHQWWFNQIIPAPWEIYMDDLPVAHVGTTMEEKLASLERDIVELARVMTKYRHTISLAKCKFGYEALDILGLRVEKGTVVPGSKVSQRLASLTEPKTREEAEHFIASANAWRKHYANFARPEAVIRDALKGLEKGDRLPRTKEVREAIAEIKTGLERAYNTFYPAKKGGTMIVQTDFKKLRPWLDRPPASRRPETHDRVQRVEVDASLGSVAASHLGDHTEPAEQVQRQRGVPPDREVQLVVEVPQEGVLARQLEPRRALTRTRAA
jgi:hypothetical protein